MKRTIGILAGVAALGVLAYVGNHVSPSFAQNRPQQYAQQPQLAGPLKTRIAIINLGQVIKNYQKFKDFEADLKRESESYQKALVSRRDRATALQAEMSKPTTDAARRDQLEKEIKGIQREMQDLTDEGKQKLGKKEYDQLVQTYKEVQDAVTFYARAKDIELVMHYNDGIGSDAYLPQIFQRKITNGACWPMYIAPGMDITADVTTMLNSRFTTIGATRNETRGN